DLETARIGPRRLKRGHYSFCSGISEPDLFDGRKTAGEQLSQVDFRFRRHADRRAKRKLLCRRFCQDRMGVAMDERREIVAAIDELVAVDVPDPAAFTPCSVY